MLLLVTILHFIVAFLLITFVLIQDSKGGGVFGMGSAGGSNQVFSATGAANFLVKATRVLGILFAVTCISLTYLTTTKKSGSVVDDYVAPAATPKTPADAAAAGGTGAAAPAPTPNGATPTTGATQAKPAAPNAAPAPAANKPPEQNKK